MLPATHGAIAAEHLFNADIAPEQQFAHEDRGHETLRKTLHMEELVTKHTVIMDKYDPSKRVSLAVDEWGTWYQVEPGTHPRFLYQQNTMRDALVAAACLTVERTSNDFTGVIAGLSLSLLQADPSSTVTLTVAPDKAAIKGKLKELAGLLKRRMYTYRWVSLLVWLYFTEGVVRAWSDPAPGNWLAGAEIALCLLLFALVRQESMFGVSAASAANAVVDTVRSLTTKTPGKDWTSVCVCSDGSYGVPEGLISSFPCNP